MLCNRSWQQSQLLENIQTSRIALEQAKEALRVDRLRLQALIGSQTDVIQSENLLTISLKNEVRAIIDYNRALARLTQVVYSDKDVHNDLKVKWIPTPIPFLVND